MDPTTLFAALLGLSLAAASGFRVFVPSLVLALAARFGGLELPAEAAWLEHPLALTALAVATVAEVGAYYVPLLDNLLDTLALPAAGIAGTLLARAFFPEAAPLAEWTAAAVLGGGAALGVQGLTSLTRLASTGSTAGLANPVVATGENVAATGLSLLALAAPAAAVALVLILLVVAARKLVLRRRTSD